MLGNETGRVRDGTEVGGQQLGGLPLENPAAARDHRGTSISGGGVTGMARPGAPGSCSPTTSPVKAVPDWLIEPGEVVAGVTGR